MKNKLSLFVLLIVLVVTVLSFQSCSNPKYTVWTETETYAEFKEASKTTLEDGYYVRSEITKSQWEEISKNLNSEGRHKWDEATIKKWLVANGFGMSESTKEASWLVLVDHGLLVSRSGNLVYVMLK